MLAWGGAIQRTRAQGFLYIRHVHMRRWGPALEACEAIAELAKDPAVAATPSLQVLVRIRFIIEMIWWIGLAPWEFEFPFPGSLISTLQVTLNPKPSALSPQSSTLNP